MSKDKMLPEKYFKDWNGIEHKWLLSTPYLSPFTKNYTNDEKASLLQVVQL